MLTDLALLERYVRERDQSAFTELARRYMDLVNSAAARRVGDRHLAEDITQAVFMILARKPASAARTAPLSAWLLNTVRYAAANALKTQRRRLHHHALAARQASASAACSPNPSDVLVWQEVAAHLDDAVLALPARDRQVVLLRYFQNNSIDDVAAATKSTEGAVKQRLSRSIEKLRKKLIRRGVVFGAEGAVILSALLAEHAVKAAPARLFQPRLRRPPPLRRESRRSPSLLIGPISVGRIAMAAMTRRPSARIGPRAGCLFYGASPSAVATLPL